MNRAIELLRELVENGLSTSLTKRARELVEKDDAFVFPPMPHPVVQHEQVGPLFDRLSMQFYGAKCMALAVGEWLPIATAPRDGTTVLLRFGQDGISQGRYAPELTYSESHPWEFIDVKYERTWFVNCAVDTLGGPSHWMPMPGDKA